MSQIENALYLAMLKNPPKKSLDPDPEAQDFQNLISSSLPTDMYLW